MEQVAILREGEGFGELALICNQPRSASILCREEAYFATLTREDYTRILSRGQSSQIETKVLTLTRQSIFKSLSKPALQRLSYFFRVRRFSRKQVVFEADTDSTHLFLVKEGEFRLTKAEEMQQSSPTSQKTAKMRIDVALITVGEFIGSEEVVGRRPYRYTCVCYSTIGELLAIARKDFFHLLGNEETLTYFSALGKVREEYRQQRVKTLKKVQSERHAVLVSHSSSLREMSLSTSIPSDSSLLSRSHRGSEVTNFLSRSFSSQKLCPKVQSSLRDLLANTSGKRMLIRTQTDRTSPKQASLIQEHRNSGKRIKSGSLEALLQDWRARRRRSGRRGESKD